MKKSQGFSIIPVLAIVMALVVLTMIGWATVVQFTKPKPAANQNAVACTLDAKVCPDGTSVGRVPPTCEFAACPETNTNTTANVSGVVCTADVKSCQDGTYVNRVPPDCEFAECPDGVTPGFVVQDGTTIYTNEEHGFRLSISGTYECNAVNCPATGDTMGLGRDHIYVSVAKTGTAATPRDWLKAAAGEDYANLVISDTSLGGVRAASVDSVKFGVALNWDGATDGTGNALIAANGSKLTVALKNGKAYVVELRVGLDMSPDSSRYDAVLRAFTFTDQTAATKD